MIRLLKPFVAIALAAAALVAAPRAAHADPYGYVCTIYENWNATSGNGKYGYLDFALYSQPNCNGTYQGVVFVHSTGSSYCPAGSQVSSGERLHHIYEEVMSSTLAGLPVGTNTFPGAGGSGINYCAYAIYTQKN